MIAWAIEALVASTILMLVVLAARGPVRRAFGAEVAYALWLLPALRLILPPLPGGLHWTGLVAPVMASGAGEGNGAGSARLADAIIAGLADGPEAGVAVANQGAAVEGMSLAATAMSFALLLWVAGAALFLAYHLFSHRRFCAQLLREGEAQPGPEGVRVIATPAAAGPLAFGIWSRYVVFPADFGARYDEQERDLALAHELSHHARGDLAANWAALAVLALHWFNPVAWHAFRAFRSDQEMACDARVLKGRDPAFRHAYGRAIVKAAHGGAVSAACHLHTIDDLKGRLKMLSTARKSRRRVLGGAASVAGMMLAGLGLTASGTQAATRISRSVSQTIGVDVARVRLALPKGAAMPATTAALSLPAGPKPLAEAGAEPPVPTVPLPPSQAAAPSAPAAPAAPAAPSAPVAPQVADDDLAVPPTPPLPPTIPAGAAGVRRDVTITTTRGPDGHGTLRYHIIQRDKDGTVLTDTERAVPEVPQITSGKCPQTGNGNAVVIHTVRNGKPAMVICTDRIERAAAEAQRVAANTADIERSAYQAALGGLRSARARTDNAEAVKALDQAIAELEQDIARLR